MPKRKNHAPFAPTPTFARPQTAETGCTIIFGHNVEIRRVLMQFTVMADRIIFTPDEARDVADKLRQFADAAEGK